MKLAKYLRKSQIKVSWNWKINLNSSFCVLIIDSTWKIRIKREISERDKLESFTKMFMSREFNWKLFFCCYFVFCGLSDIFGSSSRFRLEFVTVYIENYQRIEKWHVVRRALIGLHAVQWTHEKRSFQTRLIS